MIDTRRRAREAAVQMLYQREVGRTDVEHAIESFWTIEQDGAASDRVREFAASLARGTVAALERSDPLIAAAAEHWRLERMAIVDRIVLQLAVYELLAGENPPGVVINEALELARTFSTEDAVRFINGVLDAIRKKLEK